MISPIQLRRFLESSFLFSLPNRFSNTEMRNALTAINFSITQGICCTPLIRLVENAAKRSIKPDAARRKDLAAVDANNSNELNWKPFRRIRLNMLLASYSWPIWLIGLHYILVELLGTSKTQFIIVGIFTIYAAIVVVPITRKYNAFRCPNCGNPFNSRAGFHYTFARSCLHCKIRFGEMKRPSNV